MRPIYLLVLIMVSPVLPLSAAQQEPYLSTYSALPSGATLITHATLLTGTGERLDDASPTTPNVWAEHSVWPKDPGFSRALAGGITTLQTLPGSANLFGGRGVTLKNVYSTSYQGMKFPGAPHGLISGLRAYKKSPA